VKATVTVTRFYVKDGRKVMEKREREREREMTFELKCINRTKSKGEPREERPF
jgi:hypothetical protein